MADFAHIMVDLETWGTTPGSALRSIGAVEFDPATAALGRRFLVNISRASCEAIGMTVDPQTEAWWRDQSAEAQAGFYEPHVALGWALQQLREWMSVAGEFHFWCHGPSFDEPLLAAAYRAVGSDKLPWSFHRVRCTRTVYDLAGVIPDRSVGVHHNALDDAIAQARAVAEAYAILKPKPVQVAA